MFSACSRTAVAVSWSSQTSASPATRKGCPRSATSAPPRCEDGGPLPQVAQPAIQGGRHVAAQIVRRRPQGLPDGTVPIRRQGVRWPPSAATRLSPSCPTGSASGGSAGGLGWPGSACTWCSSWAFANCWPTAMVNWAWNYFTYDRGARLLAEADRGAPSDTLQVAHSLLHSGRGRPPAPPRPTDRPRRGRSTGSAPGGGTGRASGGARCACPARLDRGAMARFGEPWVVTARPGSGCSSAGDAPGRRPRAA